MQQGRVGVRTAVHDSTRVQVLHPRRDLAGDVQHLGHVRRVVLRPLATAQEAPVHRRLRTRRAAVQGWRSERDAHT